jgi:hypothetical protein
MVTPTSKSLFSRLSQQDHNDFKQLTAALVSNYKGKTE